MRLPKWFTLIKNIEAESYIAKIATQSQLTYQYAHKTLNDLESEGFIHKEKLGKKTHIHLTKKGTQCKKTIMILEEYMQKTDT